MIPTIVQTPSSNQYAGTVLRGENLFSRSTAMSENHSYTGKLLLLCLLCLPSLVQAERLPIKTYTTADGLAHNVVNRIVRDSHGFLWFCTNEGLSRFDGYSFRNFGTQQGLPHGVVNDLLETRAASIGWQRTAA